MSRNEKSNEKPKEKNNVDETSFRKPKVQNFRSLKQDLQKATKDPNKSLAKIVLQSKQRQWEELEKGDTSKKVFVENIYTKPIYKILLIVVMLVIVGLVFYRTSLAPQGSAPSSATSTDAQMTPTNATTSALEETATTSTSTFTNE